MRFLFKLVVLILLAVVVQRYVIDDARSGEIWYGLRCDYAYLTHDDQLLEQLLDEAHDMQQAEYEQIVRRANAGRPALVSTD